MLNIIISSGWEVKILVKFWKGLVIKHLDGFLFLSDFGWHGGSEVVLRIRCL